MMHAGNAIMMKLFFCIYAYKGDPELMTVNLDW